MRKCPVTDHTSMILKSNDIVEWTNWHIWHEAFPNLFSFNRSQAAADLYGRALEALERAPCARNTWILANRILVDLGRSGCCARGERIWFFRVPFTAVYVIYILHFPKAALLIFSGSARNQKEVHCQNQGILGLVRIVTVLSSGAMSILLRILAKDMGCFCQAKLFW